jgi:CubicO group peptidase (beta-lactamase class C family)
LQPSWHDWHLQTLLRRGSWHARFSHQPSSSSSVGQLCMLAMQQVARLVQQQRVLPAVKMVMNLSTPQ